MKHYYALFKKTAEAVEVEFPDLAGCVTFGKNFEEALSNAEDVLAAWLANADTKFLKPASKHHVLESQLTEGELIPIPVDPKILASYQSLRRFNVIFPEEILRRIDSLRKNLGLKRSTFLQKAAEAYLQQHEKNT